jgi:hypothetical protein
VIINTHFITEINASTERNTLASETLCITSPVTYHTNVFVMAVCVHSSVHGAPGGGKCSIIVLVIGSNVICL